MSLVMRLKDFGVHFRMIKREVQKDAFLKTNRDDIAVFANWKSGKNRRHGRHKHVFPTFKTAYSTQ